MLPFGDIWTDYELCAKVVHKDWGGGFDLEQV